MKKKPMNADEFDEYFDNGGSVMPYVDLSTARRPNLDAMRANVDFPRWMITALDKEAARIGIARQALIKMWIAEKLKDVA